MRRIPPRYGIDFNSGVDIPRAKQAGVSFVVRYLSDDDWAFNRNLTPQEAKAWADTRTDIVTCWQNGKSEETKLGFDSGVRCAKAADEQQAACGGNGQPVYFAVDFWPKLDDRPLIPDFFAGARSVLGLARMGAYGPRPVMDLLFGTNSIQYGWQSSLWQPDSNTWHPQAVLRQFENTDLSGRDDFGANGYLCLDHAVAHDFGQWRPQL